MKLKKNYVFIQFFDTLTFRVFGFYNVMIIVDIGVYSYAYNVYLLPPLSSCSCYEAQCPVDSGTGFSLGSQGVMLDKTYDQIDQIRLHRIQQRWLLGDKNNVLLKEDRTAYNQALVLGVTTNIRVFKAFISDWSQWFRTRNTQASRAC